MKYIGYILCLISAFCNVYVINKIYRDTLEEKKKVKLLDYFVFLITATIIIIVNIKIKTDIIVFILLFTIFLLNKITLKEKVVDTLLKSLVIYFMLMICDIVASSIIMSMPFYEKIDVMSLTVTKAIGTFVDTFLLIGITKIPIVKSLIKSLFNYISKVKDKIFIIMTLIICLITYILSYFHIIDPSFLSFIVILAILLSFFVLSIISLIRMFESKKLKIEQDSLLLTLNEYEKLLERDRINRHEMLNNLIIIKSLKNMDDDNYNEIIDNIIEKYDNSKHNSFTSLYKLPSGIKGVIYYKMALIKEKDIDFKLLIPKESSVSLESLTSKTYYVICKILGILLDNAIEASSNSSEKLMLIDIYNDDDKIIIYIENSYSGKVNIKKINDKGYSSKGNGRGYGLYIIKQLIKKNDNLKFEQYINGNKFVSILSIEKED